MKEYSKKADLIKNVNIMKEEKKEPFWIKED